MIKQDEQRIHDGNCDADLFLSHTVDWILLFHATVFEMSTKSTYPHFQPEQKTILQKDVQLKLKPTLYLKNVVAWVNNCDCMKEYRINFSSSC